jgi:hypothetical protein
MASMNVFFVSFIAAILLLMSFSFLYLSVFLVVCYLYCLKDVTV